MMGLTKYAPNAAVRSEATASMVITRVITARYIFIKNIQNNNNRMVKNILEEAMDRKSKWNKILKG